MTDAKQKKLGIEKLTCSYRFSLVSQLRHSITEVVTENFDEIGYIEPGHGMKGKKLWIRPLQVTFWFLVTKFLWKEVGGRISSLSSLFMNMNIIK